MSTEQDLQVFDTPQQIGGLVSGLHVTQLVTGWSHILAITGLNISFSSLIE